MRVEFRVLAYESVEIPDDEANNPLIIEKLKAGKFEDMEALLGWIYEHDIEHDYDFHQESIIEN